jgi:RNA polymerase sigma factor (sigma-70 family)
MLSTPKPFAFEAPPSAQLYPVNFEAYRRVRLAEEERLRPRGEVLFCELRGEELDDDQLVSRLSCRGTSWREEEADSTESEPYPVSLRTALRGLPPRSRTILLLSYEGRTKRAIAQRLGICPQRVSQIIEAALHHLKKHHLKKQNNTRNQSVRSKAL